jgi:copper chaperone NosL
MTSIARAVPLAGTAPVRASGLQRALLALSAVLLGVSVLFPLWKISLIAPQYPEGLGMHIWAHTVSGIGPNDLQNINGLNHYIGMATIEPDEIKELEFMRPGMIAMSVLGLALALLGRRRLIVAWCGALVIAALAGMADFYKWEYDYGHNLDYEHAPIKIPGMAYQPPLIGSKKLLNSTATSLPATGGVLAIASVALGVAVVVSMSRVERRSGK